MIDDRLKSLAERVSNVTLANTFEIAFRYAITFLDGYNTLHSKDPKIDLIDFIIELSRHDNRFKDGIPKKKIFIPSSKFKEVGTVYVGKPECKEIIDSGDCGLLYTFNDGVFSQ